MKIKYITWIENYEDKHYLSIGKEAPWLNRVQIRVPLFIAKIFK